MIWKHQYSQLDAVPLTWTEYKRIITETKDWPGGPLNIPPTQYEQRDVSSFIGNKLFNLKNLEAYLQHVQATYANIERQRNRLSREIEAYKAYISPILQMPDDVVREIMLRCLSSDPLPSHMNKHMAPMLLTQICSRWRKIAHTTPRLWSSLAISFRRMSSGTYPRQSDTNYPSLTRIWDEDSDAMRWWLGKAGACLIDLSFRNIPEFHPDDGDDTFPYVDHDFFFKFLLKTSHRCASIDLTPSPEMARQGRSLPELFVSKVLSHNFPFLTSIKIRMKQEYWEQNKSGKGNALFSPNLRRLTCLVDLGSLSKSVRSPPSNWSQLTVLILIFREAEDIDDAIRALPVCDAIERLVLAYRPLQTPWHNPRKIKWNEVRTVFYHLHTLTLDMPSDYISRALCVISAPILEDLTVLTVSTQVIIPDFFADELRKFFKQSSLVGSTRVAALQLDPIHYTRSTFYEVLEMFPAVSKLTFVTEWSYTLGSFRRANVLSVNEYHAQAEEEARGIRDSSHVNDAFLHRLAMTPTSRDSAEKIMCRPLLPQLEDFTCLTRSQFRLSTLQQFLSARRPAFDLESKRLARFRRLELLFGERTNLCESELLVKTEVVDALRHTKAGGLALKFKSVAQLQSWRRWGLLL